MKKSKRSNVDPFIVMDVMESARKAEKNGKHIIQQSLHLIILKLLMLLIHFTI